MDRQLPDYKETFLRQMEQLRKLQQASQQLPLFIEHKQNAHMPQNNILNTFQYSQPLWKNQLLQTSSRKQHGDPKLSLNLLINPQIKKKAHNINITPISEYSNAKHNNTVFVNPKHTSC